MQAHWPRTSEAATMPCVWTDSTLRAQGLRAALEATMRIKGLLEMMFDKLSGWIDEFITDMEARLCRTCASHVLHAELWRKITQG